ncbi:MAG: GtrA family protein [Thermoguttaceae bacterium]
MLQFLKYFIVGGFAAFVDIGSFTFLTVGLGWNHFLANTLSFTTGLLLLYFGTYKWVFRKPHINILGDFVPFTLIGLIGLPIQTLVLYGLIDCGMMESFFQIAIAVLGVSLDLTLILPISKVSVAGIIFLGNFFARKFLVFGKGRE